MSLLEFYPTPPALIEKMLIGINVTELSTILEPSAGQGDIVNLLSAMIKDRSYRRYDGRDHSAAKMIDCIELDENLRHILKGKNYRVVHDDFLTYFCRKRYDLIIMNPPFSDGDKHLLKALDIQQYGGKIRCLLNAETLKNPYTNNRKALLRKLESYGAEIEYLQGEFLSAERKTSVEVALVKVDIPDSLPDSIIIDTLKRAKEMETAQRDPDAVAHGGFIEAIVGKYRFEVDAGVRLINEYNALQPYIADRLKQDGSSWPILELKLHRTDDDTSDILNGYIRATRLKYWEALFKSPQFTKQLTTNLQNELSSRVGELRDYEFSAVNILELRTQLSAKTISSIENTILNLFDEFSRKHHWSDETSKNIHYFDGWATNKAHKINKKVIIPLNAYDDWSGKFRPRYEVSRKLSDIEKCFDFLDAGHTEPLDIDRALDAAAESGQTKNIPLKYFDVTFYKKGTTHIVFKNDALLAKFNLFGCQRKGWLPPSYGKTPYGAMNPAEQAAVNAYEGKTAYDNVMANLDYYIVEPQGLLQLDAAA